VPLKRNLFIQDEDDDFKDDFDLELDDNNIELNNLDKLADIGDIGDKSSSTIKSDNIQLSLESPNYDQHKISSNTADIRKNILNKLKEKYGLIYFKDSQKIQINILTANRPVKDIFEFFRNATNIDLLKQPIFSINNEK